MLNRLRVSIAKRVLPKAAGIRVVSKRIADSLKTSGINLRAESAILPVFSDLERFEEPPALDLHNKYPKFKFIILMVSRLAKEKNIPLALEALALVVKKFRQAGLVVVGDGPEEGKLRRLTVSLGIADNVIFEPWQKEIGSYYKTANMLLLTSLYEGYGLVLAEAAAAGCPFVSTDVGIAREICGKQYEKFVCPVGDEKCLAKNILNLLGDNYARSQYSLDLKLWAESRDFPNLTEYVNRYRQILEDCLIKS